MQQHYAIIQKGVSDNVGTILINERDKSNLGIIVSSRVGSSWYLINPNNLLYDGDTVFVNTTNALKNGINNTEFLLKV